jgi:hypothetical protein
VFFLLFLAAVGPAAAQTDDPAFGGWRFAPELPGARVAGLGGAFVAVADDVRAATINPAGLVLIPVSEIQGAVGSPWAAAATGLHGLHGVRLAAYAHRPLERRVPPGGEAPFLRSTVWEAGVGVGYEPFRRISLGASLGWSRASFDGEGAPAEGTRVSGAGGHVRLTAGALVHLVGRSKQALPSLRLGLAYQPGFDWSADVSDGSGTRRIAVRRPTVVSAGLGWRASDRWTFSAQGDVVRLSEVVRTLRGNVGGAAAEPFRQGDTVEPRAGAEWGAPLWCGCGSVKLRAGLHYRSPGTLRYEGDDPARAAAFSSRDWRVVTGAGASFFTEHFGNAVRLDLDARDVFDGPNLSFAATWRF